MNKEKLVEEIASLIKIVAIHRDHEVTQATEGAAMAIVALTLSAVHNGLEIPGEVGRWMPSEKLGLQSWSVDMSKIEGARTFIALRPLTGKKEEK